jgi:hypothetical protein
MSTLLTQQQLRQTFREQTGRPLSHQALIQALQQDPPLPSVVVGKRRLYEWRRVAIWLGLEAPAPALQVARDRVVGQFEHSVSKPRITPRLHG